MVDELEQGTTLELHPGGDDPTAWIVQTRRTSVVAKLSNQAVQY